MQLKHEDFLQIYPENPLDFYEGNFNSRQLLSCFKEYKLPCFNRQIPDTNAYRIVFPKGHF